MLKEEFSDAKITESYDAFVIKLPNRFHPRLKGSLKSGRDKAIDDLCAMVRDDLVKNCKSLETGYKEKCAEIKR